MFEGTGILAQGAVQVAVSFFKFCLHVPQVKRIRNIERFLQVIFCPGIIFQLKVDGTDIAEMSRLPREVFDAVINGKRPVMVGQRSVIKFSLFTRVPFPESQLIIYTADIPAMKRNSLPVARVPADVECLFVIAERFSKMFLKRSA